MSAPWTGFAGPAASSQALVTITSTGGGQVPRLSSLAVSLAAATSVNATFQITDGSGGGTVLWSIDMAIRAGGDWSLFEQAGLDYRASGSNPLVIGFSSGAAGMTQKINANGDFVQVGVPAFASPIQA